MVDSFSIYNKRFISVTTQKNKIRKKGARTGSNVCGEYVFECNSKKILKWTFKIHRGTSIGIGIELSYLKSNDWFCSKQGSYAYFGSNAIAFNNGVRRENCGNGFSKGDVVEMVYDGYTGLKGIISFKVTSSGKRLHSAIGQTEYIKFEKGAIKTDYQMKMNKTSKSYRMCCYLQTDLDCVELLSFKEYDDVLLVKDKDDKKQELSQQNRNVKATDELMMLKTKLARLELQCAHVTREKKEFQEESIHQKSRISSLESENQSLQQQVALLQVDLRRVQNEKDQLQEVTNSLLDEQKEMQLKMEDLKQENKQLESQCIDVSKYESWNHSQIVMWILSIENGRFNKYKHILITNLKEEGISGKHLQQVNIMDIKAWGVKNFEDKKLLMSKIKRLINNTNEQEGVESGGYYK